MGDITTVAGVERRPRGGGLVLEYDRSLKPCPMCGHEAGFSVQNRGDPFQFAVWCSNNSCRVMLPYHYKAREDAAYAWNRRPGDAPKRPGPA